MATPPATLPVTGAVMGSRPVRVLASMGFATGFKSGMRVAAARAALALAVVKRSSWPPVMKTLLGVKPARG